jgi:lycopene cyclase domain-containing protein
MSYWAFHLVFILPVIGVLFFLNRRTGSGVLPEFWKAIALIALMALLYTTPWDNYLIYRGVWSYNLSRISQSLRIGYVPMEEYCFFLLQPVLTGQYLLFFGNRYRRETKEWFRLAGRRWHPRIMGGLFGSTLGLLGGVAIYRGGHWTYFGLIFVWASPVLCFHWLYGGDHLWRARRLFSASLVSATVYLWVVDRIALEWGIWSISPAFSTGWNVLGLPAEEAVFFLLTNMFVIQGLLLFFEFVGLKGEGPQK